MPATLTWLSLLPLEIDGIEDFKEPLGLVAPNETLRGVMDIPLRKLHSLWRAMEYESDKLNVEISYNGGRDSKLVARGEELEAKAKCLERLFWISVRDTFGLWGYTVGIREGWKVVTFDYPVMQSIKDFFSI